MGHYLITVEHTVEDEVNETAIDYKVVLCGYCGNDGGQSDVEGETEYFIDEEQVEDFKALPDDVKALFWDMEANSSYWSKKYKTTHEEPQPYSEWD